MSPCWITSPAGPCDLLVESSVMVRVGREKGGLCGAGRSDACAGEGSVFGEDDDASLAGDVAFH